MKLESALNLIAVTESPFAVLINCRTNEVKVFGTSEDGMLEIEVCGLNYKEALDDGYLDHDIDSTTVCEYYGTELDNIKFRVSEIHDPYGVQFLPKNPLTRKYQNSTCFAPGFLDVTYQF